MSRIYLPAVLLAASAIGLAQVVPPAPKHAETLIDAAQKRAARESKGIFIVFDASW